MAKEKAAFAEAFSNFRSSAVDSPRGSGGKRKVGARHARKNKSAASRLLVFSGAGQHVAKQEQSSGFAIMQMQLATYTILRRDYLAAREAFCSERRRLLAIIEAGGTIEPGPFSGVVKTSIHKKLVVL